VYNLTKHGNTNARKLVRQPGIELDWRIYMNPDWRFARIMKDGRLTCGAIAILWETVHRVLHELMWCEAFRGLSFLSFGERI
jgi:hypothetical protein